MKFKILIIIAFIGIGSLGMVSAQEEDYQSSDKGIQFFEGTWDEALAKAKKENKPIFLDVYASWCAPCKLLKQKTFPDAQVGKYYNENFINVTLDGEKGDGIKVAKELNVQAYPSLFILNYSGEAVAYYPGYLQAKEFIELGKVGLDQLNTN